MSKLTTKKILKAIGCAQLQLHRSPKGYFYFVYVDPFRETFEDRSVMVFRLEDMSFESWVAEGKALVAEVRQKIEERKL